MNKHGNDNYLGSCGYAKQCPKNQAVYTYKNEENSYIKVYPTTGLWKIVSNQGKSGILHYGDTIQLHAVNSNWRLVVCGPGNCNSSTALGVATTQKATSLNVDSWKLVPDNKDLTNRDPVKVGDSIKLLCQYTAWIANTSWLVTCGMGINEVACGNGQLYSVKTCHPNSEDSNNNVSNWVIKRTFNKLKYKLSFSNDPYISYDNTDSMFTIDSSNKYLSVKTKKIETFANYPEAFNSLI